MVAKRLSKLSSNEEIFKSKRKKYEEALEDSGYNTPYFHKMFGKVDGYDGKNLVYIPDNEQKQKKKRQARTVTWFNPPYNLNTQTNVGRKFLNLVKEPPRARKWIEIEKGLRQKWTGGTKLGPIVSEKKWKSKSDNAPFSRKIASKSGSLNKKILKVPEIKN